MINLEELKEVSYKATNRYFTHLSLFGSMLYSNVYKMIAYLYIEKLLNGHLGVIMTEDEFRIVTRAMYCLFGDNCLIPYPEYLNNDSLLHPYNSDIYPRITEDDITRITDGMTEVRFKQ